MTYRDTIELDRDEYEAVFASIEDFLRGIGSVEVEIDDDVGRFKFEVEIDGDLWDARARAEEVEIELGSWGIHYTADRAKIEAP